MNNQPSTAATSSEPGLAEGELSHVLVRDRGRHWRLASGQGTPIADA